MARPLRNDPARANCGTAGTALWLRCVVMDPLYGSAAGSESGNYPMFLSGSGVAAIASRPCRMANRAASVRVLTPSLA